MGWLSRLFPGSKKPATPPAVTEAKTPEGESIPPERVGLDGEYDQSGLAKRVAAAFDSDSQLDDVDTLWVAQTGGTVVLKGKVPTQAFLDQAIAIAEDVEGATSVDSSQVTVG
ncbi:BON domain-containing protein [Gloeocapsa sp. PCC 73106]|uniref:BON domain-containing protein n=1 Tax=Gloeocapsa sp. PCC 73106 TaxID=102232 RepID=UPI0002ABBFF5|nr:BON domain-containing protein [Gloeocapsa sp. PCC 73106]ELR98061.1 putative periplasmic or secreted lipoprotein [Gloeocapsa sp. PCC 73106]